MSVKAESLGYPVPEAAGVAGVGRTLLYEAIGRGELRARKIGRRTVILREDLENWLRSRPDWIPTGESVESNEISERFTTDDAATV